MLWESGKRNVDGKNAVGAGLIDKKMIAFVKFAE